MDNDKRGPSPRQDTDTGRMSQPGVDRLRFYTEAINRRLEEVQSLHKQMLSDAETVCSQNEKAYENIKNIRYQLVEARSLSDLLTVLLDGLHQLMVDEVFVILSEDILNDYNDPFHNLTPDHKNRVRAIKRNRLASTVDLSTRMGPAKAMDIFRIHSGRIWSCALTPLIHHQRLMGWLSLGSTSVDRFSEDRSPDLLDDLAVTAALCLDNVLAHEKNEFLATTDSLTGLFNRRYFYEYGQRTLALAARHDDALSCVYIDLNDFKSINDTLGHDAGDLVLKKLAANIKARLRQTDVIARLGGDEFAILLPRVNRLEAEVLVEDIRVNIGALDFTKEGFPDLRLSASFGISDRSEPKTGLDELLARADQAMYGEKANKPK